MSETLVIRVVPHPGHSWRVENENTGEVVGIEKRKPDAIRRAKELAKGAPAAELKILNLRQVVTRQHRFGEGARRGGRVKAAV